MSAFLNQQLTSAGWDALSIALGGGRLTFYKMQAGSGVIANDEAIPPMTALVSPICDIPITSYVIEGDGQITLFGNIASKDLDAGFTFKELGVFATIEDPIAGKGGTPSGPNISALVQTPVLQTNPVVPPPAEGTALMYSYCNSYDASDYIPGSGESTEVVNTVQVTIKIDQAPDVQINILQGQQLSLVNIGPPSVGAGPWSYTQANVAYMKRLVEGPAMVITEDADTITIGQRQLTADLDLYVANGNPDISPDFSTIQNALDYLGQYLIPTTIRARIHVQRGVYSISDSVKITHPNARNITIQGPQNATLNANSITSITGSAYTWNVTFGGISSTTGILVNDWVIANNPSGNVKTTLPLFTGFFKVTAVTATTVTVRIPWRAGSFASPGALTMQLTPITAIVSPVLNSSGFDCGPYGIGIIRYLGIAAAATPTANCNGLATSGRADLEYVGVSSFNPVFDASINRMCSGIVAGTALGTVACTNCAVTYCTHGYVGSTGGNVSTYSCASTHNLYWGLWYDAGGSCFVAYGNTFAAGNGNVGIVDSAGTTIIIINTYPNRGHLWAYFNGSYGCYITGRGMLGITDQSSLRCWGNSVYDVAVDVQGLLSNHAAILDSKAINIPVGTLSSTGGLII